MADASEPDHTSLLFDVWDVPDGNQQAVLEQLRRISERAVHLPGFLEGALFATVAQRRFIGMARFASAAERRRAWDDPEMAAGLRTLRTLAQHNLDTYELVERFGSPAPEPPSAA